MERDAQGKEEGSTNRPHFRVHSKFNGRDREDRIHVNIHPIGGGDVALQALGPFRAFSVFQGALIADGPRFVVLGWGQGLFRILGKKTERLR